VKKFYQVCELEHEAGAKEFPLQINDLCRTCLAN
jgi:hypothetical protein